MMAPETQMNRSQKTTCMTFLVSLAYAIIRYCYCGDVSVHDIPLFITNKAIAVTGLVLFGIAGLIRSKQDRRDLGLLAAGCIFLHIIATLILFSQNYFEKLSDSITHRLHWYAQVSMLASIMASLCLLILMRTSDSRKGAQISKSLIPGLGTLVLILTLLHLTFMGWQGWLNVTSWHGSLPPLTLLGAITCVGFLLKRTLAKQ